MVKNDKIKSDVCKMAWVLYKENQGKVFECVLCDMSKCMKKAWQIAKLKQAMRNRVVSFSYWKKNGKIRHAHGTLIAALLPETKHTDKASNPGVITYFDTDLNQWRSCRANSLINVR